MSTSQENPGQKRDVYRLPDGASPPAGFKLPPPAPKPGAENQDSIDKSFHFFSTDKVAAKSQLESYIAWPVILLPTQSFRKDQQAGINQGMAPGRKRSQTVREKAHLSGPEDEKSLHETATIKMDRAADSVDSHDPIKPQGPLEPIKASPKQGTGPVRKATAETAVVKDELVGTTYLGKYELTQVLGAGGMGVIYKAQQVYLDRTYAIKMLKNKFASPKAKMRFHQEAKAAAALDHPGIVGIHDFGIDEQDRPYMVMEYVEGMTLDQLVKQRPQAVLTLTEALPIFIEMLEPLGRAHAKGVVHRDIKPSNIMLCLRHDGAVLIKLLDFGIAKMRDIDDRTIQGLTKTGEALGTPLYMSPEQINSVRVDSRADIYSFGCVMYMCLTGAPPFVGENKLATMDMHLTQTPLPLKEASLGLEFPPELEACIIKCLAKAPEERFQSTEALRHALMAVACQIGLVEVPPELMNEAVTSFLDDALSSPSLSPEIAQLVTEFTSLDLSTNCYADDYPASLRQEHLEAGLAATVPERPPQHTQFNQNTGTQKMLPAKISKPGETGSVVKPPTVYRGDAALNSLTHVASDQEESIIDVLPGNDNKKILIGAALVGLLLIGGGVFALMQKPDTKSGDKNATVSSKVGESGVSTGAGKTASVDPTDDDTLKNMVERDLNQKRFSIGGLGITDKGLPVLAKLKYLNALDLSGSSVTGQGLRSISNLNLGFLTLDECGALTDSDMSAVAAFKNLAGLSMRNCPGINDGAINRLTSLQALNSLDLSHTAITDKTASILGKFPHLDTFIAFDTKLDDAAAKQLSKVATLRRVYLGRTKVTDEGVAALSRLPQLTRLSLGGTAISDRAIKSLKKADRLYEVDLSKTKVTGEGLLALSSLPNLKTVNILDLNLQAGTITKFKKLRPDVNLVEKAYNPYRSD